MNHSLDSKNLNDTKGFSLVILVKSNQSILTDIAIEIGCLSTLLSYLPSIIKRNPVIANTPKRSGSVGTKRPKPMSPRYSSKLIDNGAKKANKSSSMSSLNKAKDVIKRINGNALNQ